MMKWNVELTYAEIIKVGEYFFYDLSAWENVGIWVSVEKFFRQEVAFHVEEFNFAGISEKFPQSFHRLYSLFYKTTNTTTFNVINSHNIQMTHGTCCKTGTRFLIITNPVFMLHMIITQMYIDIIIRIIANIIMIIIKIILQAKHKKNWLLNNYWN